MNDVSGLVYFHTDPFGCWGSIGGIFPVFHSLITHLVKQHGKCLSAFVQLCEISCCGRTLTASMLDACSNI